MPFKEELTEFQREEQRSSEKEGKSGKGLPVLNLNSHSHWNPAATGDGNTGAEAEASE